MTKKTLRATLAPSDPAERRQAARWRVELIVTAEQDDSRAEVIVRNLSERGLMLESVRPLELGERLNVELPDSEPVEARVVWAEGTSYGCEFVEDIPTASVSAALLRAPLAGPGYTASAPVLREFDVGRSPSVEELAEWKRRFAEHPDTCDYRIIAYKQRSGGHLVAIAGIPENDAARS